MPGCAASCADVIDESVQRLLYNARFEDDCLYDATWCDAHRSARVVLSPRVSGLVGTGVVADFCVVELLEWEVVVDATQVADRLVVLVTALRPLPQELAYPGRLLVPVRVTTTAVPQPVRVWRRPCT